MHFWNSELPYTAAYGMNRSVIPCEDVTTKMFIILKIYLFDDVVHL